jgi:hypothetical protein
MPYFEQVCVIIVKTVIIKTVIIPHCHRDEWKMNYVCVTSTPVICVHYKYSSLFYSVLKWLVNLDKDRLGKYVYVHLEMHDWLLAP